MFKIIMCCPNAADSTSLYRAAGPMANLRKQIAGLQVGFPEAFDWVVMKGADVLFLQRPHLPQHLEIAQMAKDCNLPLWVDIDDDLFNVPMENQCYAAFRDEPTREIMRQCLRLADVVTVASQALKDELSSLNQRIEVIPNAFDESWLHNYDPINKPKDKNLIFWRGSDSHVKDLMSEAEAIGRVAIAHPELKWRFCGYLPWFYGESVLMKGKVEHVKSLAPLKYFNFLKTSNAAISIVPLVDNKLNRCKSNIAWQEATLQGAAVLAPNLPEWQVPGVVCYKPGQFQEMLEMLLTGKIDPQDSLKTSLEYILEDLTLTKINRKRIDILESLT